MTDRNRDMAGFEFRTPEEEAEAAELVRALQAERERGGWAALRAAAEALWERRRAR